jgi:Domain of unknown function (DUF4395)
MKTHYPSCPVSLKQVNETTVRIIALLVTGLMLVAVLNDWFLVAFFCTIDFGIRAFSSGHYSLLRWLARMLTPMFAQKPRMVDTAPKKFAASIGFFLSLAITTLLVFHLIWPAAILALVLIVCALLEGVLGYCVGCVVYTFLIRNNIISP